MAVGLSELWLTFYQLSKVGDRWAKTFNTNTKTYSLITVIKHSRIRPSDTRPTHRAS